MHKPILQLKNVQTDMHFVDIHPWRVFTSCTIHIFADSLSEMKKRNNLTLMGPSARIVTMNVCSGFCMMQLPPSTAQLREIYSSHEHTIKQHSWEETTCWHVTVNCWTSDKFVSNKWLQLIYLQDGDHLSNSSQSNCRVGLHLIKTIHAQWTSPQNLHPNEFEEQKSEKD